MSDMDKMPESESPQVRGEYNDDSISSKKGAARVRDRVSVMFGTDNVHGAFHSVIEIVGNSMDEARSGYGNKLIVIYHEDGSVSVRDFGRGVPMGWNEKEQRYNWDLVFNELYAGGKYAEEVEDEKDLAYEFPMGLNGLGATSTQYTSAWCKVISYREGKAFLKEFKEGNPLDMGPAIELENPNNETGTLVHWKPDDKVFTSTDFTHEMFMRFLIPQAHLNKVTIEFTNLRHGKGTVVIEGLGLEKYFRQTIGEENIIAMYYGTRKNSGKEGTKKFRTKADVYLAITEDSKNRMMFFHNTGVMNQGVHPTVTDAVLSRFFSRLGREQGLTVLPMDYKDYISVAISSFSNTEVTSFIGQTKDGVTNAFIADNIEYVLADILETEYAKKSPDFMFMVERVLAAAQARKEAKEREAQRRKLERASKSSRRPIDKPDTLVDCISRDPEKTELYITEGNSAGSSCKKARDANYQAILPLRGKPPNGLKLSLDKLLELEVVKTIIKALGCGVDASVDGVSTFDESKLHWSKIIFATDADIDGQQIRVLLFTLFLRLFPKLLENGYVYVVESPLFELEISDDLSWFAYSIEERDQLMAKAAREGIKIRKIHRSKGLGENNPEMLWHTTMNPETRRLVQLKIDPKNETVRKISDMLFGNDVNNERRDYVFDLLSEKISLDMDLKLLAETVEALESGDNTETTPLEQEVG
jgi:DNA gyrase subunit B